MKTTQLIFTRLFIIILGAGWLTGCISPTEQKLPTPTPTTNPPATSIPLATPTYHPDIQTPTFDTDIDNPIPAWDVELEPITATNIDHLGLLAHLGDGSYGNEMAISPDGSLLAVAANGGVILYDGGNGELVDFYPTSNAVDSLAFSPDGQKLAYIERGPSGEFYSGGDFAGEEILKPVLTLRDVETGEVSYSRSLIGMGCGEYAAWNIAFTPDGKQLVFRDTFSFQGFTPTNSICLINTKDGSLTRAIEHDNYLKLTSITEPTPDGQAVWASLLDNNTIENDTPLVQVRRYNLTSGTMESQINIQNLGGVNEINLSPDGQWLAVSSFKSLQILSVADGNLTWTFLPDQYEISTTRFSADSKTLAIGSWDGSVKLYNIPQGELIEQFASLAYPTVTNAEDALSVRDLLFSPDNNRLYRLINNSVLDVSTLVQAISLESGEDVFRVFGRNTFSRPAISPDLALLVAGGYEDGSVFAWSAANGKLLYTLPGHSEMVVQTLFSPDGKQIATASIDGTVRIWESEHGTALATLDGHPGGVWAIGYSGDGSKLASVGKDGMLKIWNTTDGSIQESLEIGTNGWQVNSVVFTQDERAVLVVSGCTRIQICPAQGAGDLRRIDLSSGKTDILIPFGIQSFSFSVDQLTFGLDSLQGKQIGQVFSGEYQILRSFTSPYGTGGLGGATVSPDGRLFYSGNYAGLHVWDIASGDMIHLAKNRNRNGYYGFMQSTSDGRILVIAGFDGVIYLWGIQPTP